MIVKLQRALDDPDGGEVLVYDQDRTFMVTIAMTETLKGMFGRLPKIYCHAEADGRGGLLIGRKVQPANW